MSDNIGHNFSGDQQLSSLSSTSQNVPNLFADYQQRLDEQGLFAPGSSGSNQFGDSSDYSQQPTYMLDDYSSFNNYSSTSKYDQNTTTRPFSPNDSSAVGGGQGRSKQVCWVKFVIYLLIYL